MFLAGRSLTTMKTIKKIAVTGGPCAGKTTVLAYLRQKLEEKGYVVLIVPEAATLCIVGGVSPISALIGRDLAQRAIIAVAHSLEEIWLNVARKSAFDKDVVVIYDRGIPDCAAYTESELYEEFLEERGLDLVHVRDGRYDAVIHLKTAADGAEEFYTLANNAARYETAEQARLQDEKTIAAWQGCPHLRIVDNSTDFAGKIHRVYGEVCVVLGIPIPVECERKYLVTFDPEQMPVSAQRIEIEQVYLMSPEPNTVVRVRKRGQNGSYVYYQTTKKPHDSMSRLETEKIITQQEYEFGVSLKDPSAGIIRKIRTCFVYKNQYFELDQFENIEALSGKAVLEIELTDRNAKVEIPDWIHVEAEVTEIEKYSNHFIARMLGEVGE